MKRTMVLSTAVLLATWAGSGTAAQTSVTVSATVTGTCKFVSGGAMNFGNLDPRAAADVNATVTQPTLWCTRDASYTITDDGGLHNSGTNRRLQGTATGEFIPITFTYTASGTGAGSANPQTMDISGRILGADYSGASQDTYSDTVTLTINP